MCIHVCKHTHTHTHIYIYIYIVDATFHIHACVSSHLFMLTASMKLHTYVTPESCRQKRSNTAYKNADPRGKIRRRYVHFSSCMAFAHACRPDRRLKCGRHILTQVTAREGRAREMRSRNTARCRKSVDMSPAAISVGMTSCDIPHSLLRNLYTVSYAKCELVGTCVQHGCWCWAHRGYNVVFMHSNTQ